MKNQNKILNIPVNLISNDGKAYSTKIKSIEELDFDQLIIYIETPQEIKNDWGIDDIEIFCIVNDKNEFSYHCHSESVMNADVVDDEKFYVNTMYWREFIDIGSGKGECPFGFEISFYELLLNFVQKSWKIINN